MLINNPFEKKRKFHTEDEIIEVPEITVIQILALLYSGEGTSRDGKLGMRQKAVRLLNQIFSAKRNYKFWRETLRPIYEEKKKRRLG